MPEHEAARDVADRRHMARALRLAEHGLYTARPNPRVGCVVVAADGRVVGEGAHLRAGGPHAEVRALDAAGAAARGATAYVTLEPCSHQGRTPPCAPHLVEAGIARVVVAHEDPNPRVAGRGLALLRTAGLTVEVGLLASEAEALNRGFVARMRRGRPWVTVKLAQSLDGRTALASGESKWITGPEARRDVHRLRARCCAILTGSGTALADDPSLTVRLDPEAVPGFDPARDAPLRVVVDSALRLPPSAALFAPPGRCLVVTRDASGPAADALGVAGAELLALPAAGGGIDLPALLAALAGRGVNELLVEAGATLAGALLAAGLVDEVRAYVAPTLLGDDARPLLALPPLAGMAERPRLAWVDARRIGGDLRLVLRPLGCSTAGEPGNS